MKKKIADERRDENKDIAQTYRQNEDKLCSYKQERTEKQISNTRSKDFSSKAGEMK